MKTMHYKIVGVMLISWLCAAVSPANSADLPPLNWSNDIKPGITETELTTRLTSLGVSYRQGGKGLSYTSLINTEARDYLFCTDRLYAVVEGVFTSGAEFNKWFSSFLITHQELGEPERYEADNEWGRFRAEWELENGSTLYFQLQSNLEDKHGWSRQLYDRSIGAPCIEN